MKKFYAFAAAVAMSALVYTANAQGSYTIKSDLTNKIVNSDFSAGPELTAPVATYDYNMPDEGAGAGGTGLFGQQAVTGWKASNLSDNIKVMQTDKDPARTDECNARAAGVTSYLNEEDEPTIGYGGAYYAPYSYDVTEPTGGKALGIVGVWGAGLSYTQEITLPAGAYVISIPVFNTSGANAVAKNLNGFIAEDGTEYLSTMTTFAVNSTIVDEVIFRLTKETKGVISIGYKSAGDMGSGKAPHLFYDCVKLYSIDESEIIAEEIAKAKEDLLVVIEEGQQIGADVKAALAVYNDANATLEQVQKAIKDQKAINESSVTDLSEFFLTNPHFSLDEPVTGGITTYSYDMAKNNVEFYGMQPIKGWTANDPTTNVDDSKHNGHASGVYTIGDNAFLGGTGFNPPAIMSDGSAEGRVLGFVGCWTSKSQYTQHVTLPAGKYTLTISYYNTGGTSAVAKNLMGFITDDGDEYLSDVTVFKTGSWEKMTVFFELDEPTPGNFSLGYTAADLGSAAMPHFFIDGVAINYVGDIDFDPSLMALQAVVSTASELLGQDFNEDLKSDLQDAVEEGASLVSSQSSDKEANIAATEAINALLPVVNANIKAYENLEDFANGALEDALNQYENVPEIAGPLGDLADKIGDALTEFSMTTEEINDAISSLDTIITDGIKTAWDKAVASGEELDEPLDITRVLEGLSYTYSTTAYKGANVPDKEWDYGDATEFKTQYGTAEVWNQSPFAVTRTLKDMPAGTYTITTRAFYRTADNETSYDNYQSDKNDYAFVYAGHSKTGLTNVAEIANPEQVFPSSAAVAGGTLYVPNNQQSAHDLFENDEYASVLEKSVTTVLAEPGDLQFGIKSDAMSGNSWVVWYSFQIAYNAVDEELLTAELEGLMEEATEKLESDDAVLSNAKASDLLGKGITNGQNALDGAADIKEAVKQLNAALAYAAETDAITAELNNTVDQFASMAEDAEFESEDTEFLNVLSAAQSGDYQDNEEIAGYISALPKAWVGYVMGQDLSSASADNPVDVTATIINAAFDAGNANYWTITPVDPEAPVGQNQGYQNNNVYTNEETGIVVEQFIETWRKDAILNDGTVSQQIGAALPAGFYTLEVDGYAVNQAGVPEGGVVGAYLMAKVGSATYQTSIGVDNTGGSPEHFTVTFESDGKSLTTVGLLVEGTNASWMAADNFKLNYLGTTAPTAIGGIATDASATANAIYSVAGARVNGYQKGINIVKMSDGSVKKVLVK